MHKRFLLFVLVLAGLTVVCVTAYDDPPPCNPRVQVCFPK